MNGFVNADTYRVALWLDNDYGLYCACQCIKTLTGLRNLVYDAAGVGMDFDGADLSEVDFEELFDHISED